MASDLWAIVPALDLVAMTTNTVEDLLAQSIPTRVLLIDQGSSEESNDAFRRLAEQHHPRVLLWSFNPPLPSLSAAWNRGLQFVWSLGGEEALVVNSDTRLHPDTATGLRSTLLRDKALFVSAVGVSAEQFQPPYGIDTTQRGGPDFSCFMVSREGHERYPFDEGFIPCFTEDLDSHRRYMLGGDGARIYSVNLPFHHIGGGSRTINQSPEARQRFEKIAGIAREHYRQSWGGGPNQETYTRKGDPTSAQAGVTTPELQARVQAGIPVLETGRELTGGDAVNAVQRALEERA